LLAVKRDLRQKVVGAAAVAVLIGGGAFAAVSATGQRSGNRHLRAAGAAHRLHRLHRQDLNAAAGYLGVSSVQLESELRSAKSLSAVAEAHGKSSQGLIEAIVAARRARLAKAAAKLPARVGAEVAGPVRLPPASIGTGGASGRRAPARRLRAVGVFTAGHHLGALAADYLGLAPARLGAQLRAGKTLAQIADATPGRSSAGLVLVLLSARKQRLAAAVAHGRVTRARAARREARLRTRIGLLVQRSFAPAAGR
jgi:hypothetical protein